MLGIVQQQERAHAARPLGEQLVEMAAGLLFDLKGLRERRDEPARVSKRSEGGPPDPVGENPDASAAACSASRVLPVPGAREREQADVTGARSRPESSSCRPRNDVAGVGGSSDGGF